MVLVFRDDQISFFFAYISPESEISSHHDPLILFFDFFLHTHQPLVQGKQNFCMLPVKSSGDHESCVQSRDCKLDALATGQDIRKKLKENLCNLKNLFLFCL